MSIIKQLNIYIELMSTCWTFLHSLTLLMLYDTFSGFDSCIIQSFNCLRLKQVSKVKLLKGITRACLWCWGSMWEGRMLLSLNPCIYFDVLICYIWNIVLTKIFCQSSVAVWKCCEMLTYRRHSFVWCRILWALYSVLLILCLVCITILHC